MSPWRYRLQRRTLRVLGLFVLSAREVTGGQNGILAIVFEEGERRQVNAIEGTDLAVGGMLAGRQACQEAK